MLAKQVLGRSFVPDHYFRSSQDFESHGVGVEPMKRLLRLDVCCSGKQRYGRENAVVANRRDDELVPKYPDIAVVMAWDNNDTDSTAKFASAEHRATISATAHFFKAPPAVLQRLALEIKWVSSRLIHVGDLLHGRDRDKHFATLSWWDGIVRKVVAQSPTYLLAAGEGRTCLEAVLRAELKTQESVVESRFSFIETVRPRTAQTAWSL